MGLIKAFTSAASGVAKDQWKEFFMCNSMPSDILMVKGECMTNTGNNHGNSNVITNGSIFTVADGQAAIVVCQGKVVDVCTEPGEHTYHSQYSKSIFDKGGLSASVSEAARRFTFGGDVPAVTEKIYYVNTKMIPGGVIKKTSFPFHFLDSNTGLDMDCKITCAGSYSFRVAAPDLFYKLVTGNISGSYHATDVLRMMNTEISSMLTKVFAQNTAAGKRSYELATLYPTIEQTLKDEITQKWLELRGVELVSLAFEELQITGNDQATIAELQKIKVFTNLSMAAANLNSATADAMQMAAQNEGSSNVIMHVNASAPMSGNVADASLTTAAYAPEDTSAPVSQKTAENTSWTCSCGNVETAKFCRECGKPRPWTCSCGTMNSGKFCTSCGQGKM